MTNSNIVIHLIDNLTLHNTFLKSMLIIIISLLCSKLLMIILWWFPQNLKSSINSSLCIPTALVNLVFVFQACVKPIIHIEKVLIIIRSILQMQSTLLECSLKSSIQPTKTKHDWIHFNWLYQVNRLDSTH